MKTKITKTERTPADEGIEAARRDYREHKTKMETALKDIVKLHASNIPTLETRNSDRLDFHDMSVWQIKELLVAAYTSGFKAGKAAS